jgi:glycosyltransferase involved in cell wall biosynthesis
MSLLFSIIIPSFNRAHILPQALNSVLKQTYTNWELLLVDDGSTDTTETIISEFQEERIHYLKKQNGGVCSARNYGVPHAKGDYIVFLDSDDSVSENWLHNFNESFLKNKNADIICGGLERINLKTNESIFVEPSNHGNGANGWSVVIPGSFTVSKNFLVASGLYDETLKYGENTELFFRFEKNKPVVAYTNSFDLKYYPSEDGGSKNLMNMIDSNKIILEKHDDWLSDKMKYTYNQIIAVNYTRFGDQKNAAHHFRKAIKYNPFKFGTYIRFLISKSSFLRSFFYKLNFRK